MKLVSSIPLLAIAAISSCVANEQTSVPDAIATIFSQRHSGYSYDASRIVTQEQLDSIAKAGQMAPSSSNDQPWYFIICDRTTNPQAYDKVFDTLVEFNQNWAKNAPVLIVSVASTNSHHGSFNRWAQYDTGAAAFAMMIQATSLGLMAHQMGGFDANKILQSFAIPADYVVMAVMAVGYEAADQTKSIAKKNRKPLSENFLMGSWQSN